MDTRPRHNHSGNPVGRWTALLTALAAASLLPTGPASALRAPEEVPTPKVQVHVLWNRQYLCLAARVSDSMLTGSSLAPMSVPQEDDAIEFCFEVPTSRGLAAYRLALSAAGGMTVLKRDPGGHWRTDASWISGPRTVKCRVVVDGTLNDPSDTDVGFTVESGIPWEFLTGGPAADGEMGFNVVCWIQGENQGLVSWSPAVRTEEQVGDAARWGTMLVTRSSAPAMAVGARIACPFVGYTPFVDGELAAEEWMRASTLAFEKPKATVVAPLQVGGTREMEGTLLALYRYDWEGSSGRPGSGSFWVSPNGLPATVDQPKVGCGFWYSYRWVGWHRSQLEELQRAGINVILARYQGDQEARKTWARTGLDRLTHALKELRAEGNSYPLVGMVLDTAALRGVDLKSDSGKLLVYGMIRDFFLHVPPEFRAQLGARPEQGIPGGIPVLLGEPQGITDWDSSLFDFCQHQFAGDFEGARIAWLASSAWQKEGVEGFCAHVRLATKTGLTQEGAGGTSAVSIAPGYYPPNRDQETRPRREGRSYRADWQRVLASKPELVVINSWNDFANGTEIAPSRQYGYAYVDMTRLFKARLGSDQPHSLRLRQQAVPDVLRPGSEYQVELLVENVGTQEVRTGRQITADYRIVRSSDNEVVREQIGAQALSIAPGQTRRLPVVIVAKDSEGRPLPPGEYVFSLSVMKSRVSYLRSKWFAGPIAELTVPIVVGDVPMRRATVVSTSLPCSMESGATEQVVVRLRNDGAVTWRAGTTKLSYHWVRHRDDLRLASAEARKVVVWEGARASLPHDVAPGEVVSLMIPVSATQADGLGLPPARPGDLWHYRIQWDLVEDEDQWLSGEGAAPREEAVEVVGHDWGVVLKSAAIPGEMEAGGRAEIEVVVANAGRHPWTDQENEQTYLAGSWWRWDGRASVGETSITPLARPIAPGETVTLNAQVTAPETTGMYWLVWDMVCGGEGAAARGGGRRTELSVAPVLVRGGRMRALDLSSLMSVAAVTTDSHRARGDFDGQGRSLPAECFPPDLSGASANLYPSGYYASLMQEPVPFAFPDASSGVGGAVACSGQAIALGGGGVRTVYLLAATTAGTHAAEMVFKTEEGSKERVPVTVPSWQETERGRAFGAYTPYVRTLSGDDASTGAYLHLLKLTPKAGKAVSLELPRDTSVKILAITVVDEQ